MNAATLALNPELFPAPVAGRTNRKNDGRQFQGDLETTCKAYEAAGLAMIRKVDPPVRVIWPFDVKQGKKVQRVIFMKNPYPDLIGAWTANGGRAMVVELKSTSAHRLPLNRHGGLTEEQVTTLTLWREAGAASCLLWRFGPDCRLFSAKMIQADLNRGQKSLVHTDGLVVPKGAGMVIWDFLPVLAGCTS